jgi:hypothetical protein
MPDKNDNVLLVGGTVAVILIIAFIVGFAKRQVSIGQRIVNGIKTTALTLLLLILIAIFYSLISGGGFGTGFFIGEGFNTIMSGLFAISTALTSV